MKLTHKDYELIRYLFLDVDWTPLEIADEIGLTFRQVCNHIEKHCLRKVDYKIARTVVKSTRAGIVQIPPCQ